jgi:hypothetical protein
VAVDGRPWPVTFGDSVTDLAFSPDGAKIACVAKDKGAFTVVVDGQPWSSRFEMAWRPVFSPDGKSVAARVKTNGKFAVAVDGRLVTGEMEHAWDPIFSPAGDKVLVRGIAMDSGKKCIREVLPVDRRG